MVYTLKTQRKPNRNRVKSLYDLKLTIFQLEGVKLPLLEENCAKNRQNVQKIEKMIGLHIKRRYKSSTMIGLSQYMTER